MKTYKLVAGFVILALLIAAMPVRSVEAASETTLNYDDVTLYNWGSGNAPNIWDLTVGDLTISYTLDLSGIATPGWAVVEVGLREVGAPNIDPDEKGGWMQSNYVFGTSNPVYLNDNDQHLLSKHGWLYQYYDATAPDTLIAPYWSNDNYGFWFDRDGVDEWQAAMWGMAGTYNTAGVYEIVLEYHAIDASTGTIFATINGVQQGLFIGGWKNAQPEFYPAGRSFTGDMTKLQVFWGRGGGGGGVNISDIIVVGVQANKPPVVDASGPYTSSLGSPIPIVGTASDPDGDLLTTTWTVNNTACHIADPSALSTSVACTNKGNFTLTLKVSDGKVNVTDTAPLTVDDGYLVTGINDCSHGSYDRYHYVETLFVSSKGSGAITPVVTSTTLNSAHKYLIEASGVYYAGGTITYDIRADAKYSQDAIQRGVDPFGVWTDLVHNYEGYGAGLLELKVDGVFVEWGGYNPEHVYTLEKLGTGSPLALQFQIDDIYAQNNTGGLCVSLFEFENEPPVANPNGPYLGAVNTVIAFDGIGSSDPNNDPLTYLWTFGDGNVGTGVSPTYSYASAGLYNVCLTVNDGYVDSAEVCTMVVVYDPSAGFVTGGGWIMSPAGAYTADLNLTGKATFGFVAKYKKGANVPDGNTEFQFKAGDLNFHSTSYEWLVVAGNKAQFKGVGTINGQGEYKFMIFADDGNPDTFRIKIWDALTDTVVYDNGSQQPLSGGSIVIHK